MTFWVKVLNHRIIKQLFKAKVILLRPKENIPNEISGRKERLSSRLSLAKDQIQATPVSTTISSLASLQKASGLLFLVICSNRAPI